MANIIGKAKKTRGKSQNTNKHKKNISCLIDELLEQSDIVLEILDARFIEKTRNLIIEKKIKSSGKLLIYVFSKSDLVDIDKIKKDKELWNLKPHLFFSSEKRKGANALRKMIQIESSKLNKDIVNIGVVGYPNTGKSSLINFLSGRKVAGTSSEAGYTKGIKKIKISNGIFLIDTPGLISFEKNPLVDETGNKRTTPQNVKIGAVTWDRTKNPELVVQKILEEYPGIVEKYYNLEIKEDSEEFIENLGKKMNFFVKGGLVDEKRAAKKILRDWQEGKIKL